MMLITGAAQGIGLAMAHKAAAAGARLALLDIQAEKLAAVARSLREQGVDVFDCACNLAEEADLASAFGAAAERLGPVEILVNNAGGTGSARIPQIEDVTAANWHQALSLNLDAMAFGARAVAPAMKAASFGRIINVSSTLAAGVPPSVHTVTAALPYVTSKAAILGLTAQLAKDLAPWAITVNAVLPGFTLPEPGARMRVRFDAMPEADRREMMAAFPMGRPATTAEVAAAILFLASDDASYVSGAFLKVDGAAS